MKSGFVLFMTTWLVACATTEEPIGTNKEQAIRDLVNTRQLAELDQISTRNDDHLHELDASFVIYKTRRGDYLFEFDRPCYELVDDIIVADQRWGGNRIRARFDTLRGCRIGHIYSLTEPEVAELETIGESIDGGN
ncbi:MAG: DUF6491 family protein [Woeseiaceae bacterium]